MILEAIIAGSSVPGGFNRARQVFGEMPVEFPEPGPVCRVVGLLRKQSNYVTRQTSHANDFVNAKSHAREKPLLAGYQIGGLRDELYPIPAKLCHIDS